MNAANERTRRWLLSWELYLIILIAAFLRLYRLDTSEFSGDQTFLLRLAYDAVHSGLIPATSNSSSISTANAPMAVYFLMLPAFFSPDPLWATAMTALFNVAAVLLTYIFTRRYYGRLAATIAALLYATAQTTIVFSRFIWQPSLIAPFIALFFFALFRGAVDRRKGWFFPAILLLGVLIQLQELTIVLVVPLLAAILFAPETIRVRDIVFACISLLIIFAPFLFWQISAHFVDIQLILHSTNVHPVIDSRAITFYKRFLNSYYYDDEFLNGTFYDPADSSRSVVFKIMPVLVFMRYILELCLVAGFFYAVWRLCCPRGQGKASQDEAVKVPRNKPGVRFFAGLAHWWVRLRGDLEACGLLLLLLWQVIPVLVLTRHGLQIHLHYLLMIVPGPFIFIGIVVSRAFSRLRQRQPAGLWKRLRYAAYVLLVGVLLVQLMGSSASLVDMTNGINNHIFGYNDIGSLEHAFQEADRVAQQRHIGRIYVTLSVKEDFDALLLGFPYLAGQMHTPATLFESTSCLVLPSPGEGSAVMLMRSSDTLTLALLNHFATATLIDEPPVLGSTPFKLYILTPRPFALPAPASATLAGQLHLIDSQVQQPGTGFPPRLMSRWTLLRDEQLVSRTTYNYILSAISDLPDAVPVQSTCLLTSIRAGDQLIATFPLSQNDVMAHSFSVSARFLVQLPYTITLGALHFEAYKLQGKAEVLRDMHGGNTIIIAETSGSRRA